MAPDDGRDVRSAPGSTQPDRAAGAGPDPDGAVTMMFTDIEGSTRLLRALGDERYGAALEAHERLIRAVLAGHGGQELATRGDGFFAVFDRAAGAVRAAVEIQQQLDAHPWPPGGAIRVRIGLHTGRLSRVGDVYVGLDVNRAARLSAAGHGRQVLLSHTTHAAVKHELPAGSSMVRLGEFHLRDMPHPEAIWQLMFPGCASAFPPLRALDVHALNLPVPRTRLIGREADVAEVRRVLLRDDVGLVTLTGPAGTGKTRLALAVAIDLHGSFEDGVAFVGLAPIGEPDLVVSAIAQALGLQEAAGVTLEETVRTHLRNRRMLLVLDNFEHLLPAGTLVADLLATCPGVKILVTSRSTLHLYGEHDLPVSPLAMPDLDLLPSDRELDEFPAIALFTQRAQAVKPDFTIAPESRADVAAICARLDGLPLAIELAAARSGLLSPRAMLARLREADSRGSLTLLTTGSRDMPARHQTLRDAIGWSYDLLSSFEQQLFRRLAVFVGGFSLAGAVAMMAPDVDVREPRAATSPDVAMASDATVSVLEGIASLIDKSLLQQRPGAGDAEPRFSMLETIREYGLEALAAEHELDLMRRRHAEWCLVLAEDGERGVAGAEQIAWLRRLDEEHPNLRAALGWSLVPDGPDVGLGTRIACALWVFWYRRPSMSEGSRWIHQALAANPDAPVASRAKLLTADGALARMRGEFSQARTLLEDGARLYRELGDAEGIGWALSHLGLALQWLGRLDEGIDLLEESLALRRTLGDDRGIARSLFQLGVAEHFRHEYERAGARYAESLEYQRRLGDNWSIGRLLGCLAKVELVQGRPLRAVELCGEALTHSRAVGDNWGIAQAVAGLGSAALARGDLETAASLLKQGMMSFRDVGSEDRILECLQDLASVAYRQGAVVQAVRLLAVSEATQEHIGLAAGPNAVARHTRELDDARATLGEATFRDVWSEGRAMGLHRAMEEAQNIGRAMGTASPAQGAPVGATGTNLIP